ncbi:hypothetical protein B0H17DRAFT_1091210, partial [Mycena rosella]
MHTPPDKAHPHRPGLRNPLLALLAVLAHDSPATAQPLLVAAPAPVPVPDVLAAAAAHTAKPTGTHRLPSRYAPDDDGVWRRIDSYTLVGSTICDTCSVPPTATATPTDDEFLQTVPSGWVRSSIASPARTSLTVGLSLLLTCFIAITIIRYHFWRRPRTPSPQAPEVDPEKRRAPKAERARCPPQPKVRKWLGMAAQPRAGGTTRATLRGSAAAAGGTTTRAAGPSRASSSRPTPSCPPALALALAPQPLFCVGSASVSSLDLARPETPEPPSPPPILTPLPPAYPTTTHAHAPRKSAADDDDDAPAEAHPPYTPRADPDPSSSSSSQSHSYFDFDAPPASSASSSAAAPFDPAPPPPPPASFHLATDDKALLARLAAFPSAPPAAPAAPAPALRSRAPAEEDVWDFGLEDVPLPAAEDAREREGGDEAAFPAPPPPPRAGGVGDEKRALERRYARGSGRVRVRVAGAGEA